MKRRFTLLIAQMNSNHFLIQQKRPSSQTVFLTLSCPTFLSDSVFTSSAVVRPSATPSVLSFINRILTGDALSRDAPTVNMWYLIFLAHKYLCLHPLFEQRVLLFMKDCSPGIKKDHRGGVILDGQHINSEFYEILSHDFRISGSRNSAS